MDFTERVVSIVFQFGRICPNNAAGAGKTCKSVHFADSKQASSGSEHLVGHPDTFIMATAHCTALHCTVMGWWWCCSGVLAEQIMVLAGMGGACSPPKHVPHCHHPPHSHSCHRPNHPGTGFSSSVELTLEKSAPIEMIM